MAMPFGNKMIEKTPVMVNGLPGHMAMELAKQLVRSDDFYLLPLALTGNKGMQKIELEGHDVRLFTPGQRAEVPALFPKDGLVADFTQPDAFLPNAIYYCENGMNFVIGTTGGDRAAAEAKVRSSQVNAVMAPNMAMPIVALQAKMEALTTQFQGLMKDRTLQIVESHQQGKKDTSGTAKAMVKYFNGMGIVFDPAQIVMIRDPEKQRELGVTEEYLKAHGWHTYTLIGLGSNDEAVARFGSEIFQFLQASPAFSDFKIGTSQNVAVKKSILRTSPDGSVLVSAEIPAEGTLQIKHNINGRSVYADGTLKALRFEREQLKRGAHGEVWSMIDVLRSLER